MFSIFLFFYCSGDHRHLHSFPTRRSSDLAPRPEISTHSFFRSGWSHSCLVAVAHVQSNVRTIRSWQCARSPRSIRRRSEEHTSELQSQSNLVCRLLLEKKNKKKIKNIKK